ncbi:MAG: hypothetical protein KJZ96_14895 [Rhodocyclaceae bacterium]|jgi:hypothetical protein|nr:hypothetical protein [Rhodocyclaceae bacterium]MCL4759620.1 hypothetical protein [Rhodocyclaceae bacterium]
MGFAGMTEGFAMTQRKLIPIKQAAASQEEQVEERLIAQGWRRQTTIGEPRLSEIAENYRAMGYEVHVEKWQTEGDGCTTCLDEDTATGKVLGTVYTRKSAAAPQEDELF